MFEENKTNEKTRQLITKKLKVAQGKLLLGSVLNKIYIVTIKKKERKKKLLFPMHFFLCIY